MILSLAAACGVESQDSASADSGEVSQRLEAAVSDTVSGLVRAFWEAWSQADVDRGIGFFHEDATAVTKGADILRGRSTIDAAWRPGFATIQSQVIELQESYVTVFGPDLATAQQKGTFVTTFTDGTTGDPVPFSFTEVWIRTDGDWQIIATHRSDPVTATDGR